MTSLIQSESNNVEANQALAGCLYVLTNDLASNVFTIGFSPSFTPPSGCDNTMCVFAKVVSNGPAVMSVVRQRLLEARQEANSGETFKVRLSLHALVTAAQGAARDVARDVNESPEEV